MSGLSWESVTPGTLHTTTDRLQGGSFRPPEPFLFGDCCLLSSIDDEGRLIDGLRVSKVRFERDIDWNRIRRRWMQYGHVMKEENVKRGTRREIRDVHSKTFRTMYDLPNLSPKLA